MVACDLEWREAHHLNLELLKKMASREISIRLEPVPILDNQVPLFWGGRGGLEHPLVLGCDYPLFRG